MNGKNELENNCNCSMCDPTITYPFIDVKTNTDIITNAVLYTPSMNGLSVTKPFNPFYFV